MTQCTLLDCPNLIDNIIWKNIRSHLYICWGDKDKTYLETATGRHNIGLDQGCPIPNLGWGKQNHVEWGKL